MIWTWLIYFYRECGVEHLVQKDIIFRLHMYVDGKLVDLVEEYTLSTLGDIPKIGDHIISPWVMSGLNRREPKNRTIYKVVNRYFLPPGDEEEEDWKYMVLVVTENIMSEAESVLLIGSPEFQS